MVSIYDVLKSTISGGNYKLHDVQQRIKRLFVLGDLTEEQTDELLAMASGGASADAERPETLELIQALAENIIALEARVAALESGNNSGTDDTVDAEQPLYKPWKPWDGISKDYQKGAIVSHNGELWQSAFDGQNVWEPGEIATGILWLKYDPEADEGVAQ
jgi:hypothetical protein